jgi:hypothetical protein
VEYWYQAAIPRKEVREGRSFNPDEFAVHLEQVIGKTAPEDYRDPRQFFARTCFTHALREHTGMVLRRLSGITSNAAPVMTLITQFGGGKTHTLTTMYHLAVSGAKASEFSGIGELLKEVGIPAVPEARVAAFVGNAWDPAEDKETPWIDMARQLAGDKGVKELGESAKTVPPGTEALFRVFKAANKPVLLLFDEVLNYLNRHRNMADHFYAFIQNLTVAITGITNGALVISLPRSQVEMTEWDFQWQEKITKIVRRVSKDLIANEEAEISEVIRRRLFENIGKESIRKNIAKKYADWCFERRDRLPLEWTAVDTAATEANAREYLRSRFELCYPFHPATLSVFQRKWQALPQYQQTRGTLAMFAQWISIAFREDHLRARREPLITLGSAPLDVPEFRSIVLAQLGESRLLPAIEADISGRQSHARALDADTKGALTDIHRRLGASILFESSGGQIDKVAYLPELRFALCEPEVDTTSVDNAAYALETNSYFIRRVGSDGYKINYQPTLKKVVSDRRASLDEETEIKPAMRKIIDEQFHHRANIPVVSFPEDGTAVPDTPRLTLILMDPSAVWSDTEDTRQKISEWTKIRGNSPRLYPGSLVWCLKKPGRDFRGSVENQLAWERVKRDVISGTLGSEFNHEDRKDLDSRIGDAKNAVIDEVWGGYRYAVIADKKENDNLRVFDLGAGHSSSSESLCQRIITALKSQGLLSDSVGAGYIERNWPPALKESGAWPLSGLRQSFIDGTLTRLLDPDSTLRGKIGEFVYKGDFALASGLNSDGSYSHMWYEEPIDSADVVFEQGVFLLTKEKAQSIRAASKNQPSPNLPLSTSAVPSTKVKAVPDLVLTADVPQKLRERRFSISGKIAPEAWNRLGTKIIPKLRFGNNLEINVTLSTTVDDGQADLFQAEIQQILDDIEVSDSLKIE